MENERMSVVLKSNAMQELSTSLHLTEEQKMKAASRALQLSGDDKLKDCDSYSIARFCFETARYNFARDDSAYPVPYKDKDQTKKAKIQTQIGYQGWRELAFRTGKYQNIDCSLVYSCDKVTRDRATGVLTVEFETDWTKAKGEVVGYYAFATDHTGKVASSVLLSKNEAEKHGKRYSKAYKNLWATDFDKMAMKTAIKMLVTKHLDLTDVSTNVTALIEEAKLQDQIVHGRDRDAYLDNPSTNEYELDESDIEVKSNVRNKLAPASHETDKYATLSAEAKNEAPKAVSEPDKGNKPKAEDKEEQEEPFEQLLDSQDYDGKF